jgi:hypothetical protein
MRTMQWALQEDGYDVRVVSKSGTLELRGAALPDVATFELSGLRCQLLDRRYDQPGTHR